MRNTATAIDLIITNTLLGDIQDRSGITHVYNFRSLSNRVCT